MNKENSFKIANTHRSNASLPHPSNQSQTSPYRPSIKVGYKIITKIEQAKPIKRKIQPSFNNNQKINCKKISSTAKNQISGQFLNSQYIKQNENIPSFFQKKGVSECRDKFQSGQGVKQQISHQFPKQTSRRSSSVASVGSSRSKNSLPSYQNGGIKDIMQYHHALPYREVVVTQKCTKSSALSRFCKFNQLHQFDFRKRPQFLR